MGKGGVPALRPTAVGGDVTVLPQQGHGHLEKTMRTQWVLDTRYNRVGTSGFQGHLDFTSGTDCPWSLSSHHSRATKV